MRFVLLFSIFALAVYAEQNSKDEIDAESKVTLASGDDVEVDYDDSQQLESRSSLKFVPVGDDEFN